MYTAHFNLRRKPFQISSDASFMWLGEKHKEALATLRYGILDNKGFLLLTGDVGTGKTTLINTLIASLSHDVIYASVPDPSLEKMDFFNYIGAAFGLEYEFTSKGKFLASFSSFLHRAYEHNRKVLLIIDESQLMTQELLEETRLLSNIVTQDSNPLLNIFFVGQYEFNELIRRPENRAIAQRLTLNYYIEPLSAEETGDYIRHRLKIAGTTQTIFEPSCINDIFAFSQGYPRKINVICDHCMMSAYAEEKLIINKAMVKESAADLQLPEYRRSQEDGVPLTAGQSDKLVPVEPEKEEKVAAWGGWRRPAFALFLLILVMFSCGFLYLAYTNTTYQEALGYVQEFSAKVGVTSPVALDKSNEPDSESGQGNGETRSVTGTSSVDTRQPDAGTPVADSGKSDSNHLFVDSGVQIELPNSGSFTPVSKDNKDKSAQFQTQSSAISQTASATLTIKNSEKTGGTNVDGAPPPLPKEPLVIRFKHDSNLFSVIDIERMKEFARIVKVFYPEAQVEISGYTDSTGNQTYNKKLSNFRANMVKSFLMGQNLAPEQLKAQGFGNLNPIASNDTKNGRELNRRVEIKALIKN